MHSFLAAALLASVAPSASPSQLVWQTDYTLARELATQQQKPLAVFVGTGSEGWSQVVQEGLVDARTLNVLSQDYILLYADRSSVPGSRTATALELSNSTGLVISDRTGTVQAFSHRGVMSPAQLQSTVDRFADARRVVTRTESISNPVYQPSSGILQTSYSMTPSTNLGTVPPISMGSVVSQPNWVNTMAPAAPTTYATPATPTYYAPSYQAPVRYTAPSYYTPSCPNGRCPNTVSSCPNCPR